MRSKLFLVYWGAAFHAPTIKIVSGDHFCDENGYSANQIQDIMDLRPGDDAYLDTDYGAQLVIIALPPKVSINPEVLDAENQIVDATLIDIDAGAANV